jgi:CPA2 family monovalent cation:H+ antiporter-2
LGHLATLISDLALLLVVAGATTLLCKKINQPTVIGYILAGFLIGPVVSFIPTIGDSENITLWAEIGVIFLMFSLGLEFSLHKLMTVGTTGIVAALLQIGGMMLLGYGVGILMGWSAMDSLFLGGMLSMSSTMITIKAIEDLGLKEKKFTKLAIGTLVIEDIVAIFLMVVLSTISVSQGVSGAELAATIIKLMMYLMVWLLLGIYLIPSFLQKTQNLMNNETLLVVSLGICFGMVWMADAIGFSSALGAFMAGSIMAGTVHGERIEHLVNPCKDLFGAVFFVSVGLMVVPAMLVEYFVPILILTIVTIVGKMVLLVAGMMTGGEDLETSVCGAMSQTQIGEFSFIIATLGTSLAVTSDFLYPVIVAVSVVTTFTTPFFIKSSDGVCRIIKKVTPQGIQNLVERYRAARNEVRDDEKDQDWKLFLKGYASTFLIYGILLLVISEVGRLLIYPALADMLPNATLAASLTCILIYIVMAPLLAPMMIFRKKHFTALWLKTFANHLPLMVLIVLRTGVTLFLAVRPIYQLFHMPRWALLLIVPLVFLISRSDWMVGRYLEIEARFLSNFNEKKLQELKEVEKDKGHAWLDEQVQVSEYICTSANAACDMELKELQWGRMWQVNVIKIIRGKKHINIPEGDEKLYAGDRLYLLGTAKAQENFNLFNEQRNLLLEGENDNVSLHAFIENQDEYTEEQQLFSYAVTVKKGTPLAGCSVRDSGIKSKWNAYLIGVERNMMPMMNLNANFILNADDLLWVLGPQKMGEQLVKYEML